MNRIANIVGTYYYIICFTILLLIPSAISWLGIEEKEMTEKRTLAQMPEFELSKNFTKGFEDYYDDNMGLRSRMIEWASRMKLYIFKTSPNPQLVQLGKDDFLFFNTADIQKSFTNTNLLSPKELEREVQFHVDRKRP